MPRTRVEVRELTRTLADAQRESIVARADAVVRREIRCNQLRPNVVWNAAPSKSLDAGSSPA
jgi:hypothetical protein